MNDIEIGSLERHEYVHTDDHLLGALRRYKGLRTYPTASDRSQVALHARMLQLAAKGLVRETGRDGVAIRWQSVL